MKQLKKELMMVGVTAAAVLAAAVTLHAVCENKAASDGTQPCDAKDICANYVYEESCTARFFWRYEVREDFPTECVPNQTNKMCPSTLEWCSRPTLCDWDDYWEECFTMSYDNTNAWSSLPKKHTGNCGS